MSPSGTYTNHYGWGQCTRYVAGRRQVPGNWGNANTWYPRAAAAGWSVGTTPAVGAIAWTSAGPLGHVALVEQISVDYERVYISEMNEAGLGVKSYRWVPARTFKYIYAPGY
jgi:surface antigen